MVMFNQSPVRILACSQIDVHIHTPLHPIGITRLKLKLLLPARTPRVATRLLSTMKKEAGMCQVLKAMMLAPL